MFSGRFRPKFRPDRPHSIGRILADLAGISAGNGRESNFLDSLGLVDPFCTLKRLQNLFCGDFEFKWTFDIFENMSKSEKSAEISEDPPSKKICNFDFLAKLFLWSLTWVTNGASTNFWASKSGFATILMARAKVGLRARFWAKNRQFPQISYFFWRAQCAPLKNFFYNFLEEV